MQTDMEGDMPGFFKVYVNKQSLMNISDFNNVREKFKITVDTAIENTISVHIPENRILKFKEMDRGMHIWIPEDNTNVSNKNVSSYSF